jgi:hypothetical protein
VIVGDQPDLCALVSSKAKLSSASGLLARANGKTLVPEMGEYDVGGPSDTGKSSSGSFVRTDANGTFAIPGANTVLASGVVKVTSISNTSLTAQLDVRFGRQNDPVTATFSARICGELNSVFGGSGGGSPVLTGDPCTVQSRCSADPASTQSRIDACKTATASGAKCATEYTTLINCLIANQKCTSANVTDAEAARASCATQLTAFATCVGAP